MSSLLLHTCCGPCASGCFAMLGDRRVTMYFSNSNLCSRAEYDRRLENARIVADAFNAELLADAYDHASWLDAVRGLEGEPERGARCAKCFAFSLGRAARKASELSIPFATTLTVSPHKNSGVIFEIGESLGSFEKLDFKKHDGFLRSIQNSRKLALYRQDFCGCEFSLRDRMKMKEGTCNGNKSIS